MVALAAGISMNGSGQGLSIGIVGGAGLTDSFPTVTTPAGIADVLGIRSYSSGKDLVAGPMLELRFRSHWSVELDGLHRQLKFTWAAVELDGSLNSVSPSPVVTWEFPALAKYRFEWRRVSPFVELGPSFRTAGNLNGTDPSHLGITAGVGVEKRLRGVNIAPTLRFTRWKADSYQFDPQSRANQVELLLAVSSASEAGWHPLGTRFFMGAVAGVNMTHDVASTSYPVYNLTAAPGGVLTQSEATINLSGLKTLLLGPTVEVGFTGRLSVEVDALYHPIRASSTISPASAYSSPGAYTEAITWELPVLAKYRFATLAKRFGMPFAELGPSFRLPQNLGGADLAVYGITAGAGLETHLRRLKIAPALRFTHWAADHPSGWSGLTRNQAALLTSFSF